MSRIKEGDNVTIYGTGKEEYDGQHGVIEGAFIKKKKRWPVKLNEGGKVVKVKPENLKVNERKKKGKESPKKASTKRSAAKGKKKSKKKAAAKPVEEEGFKKGARVKLVGLQSKKPEYEGKEGEIVGDFIPDKERWPVKLKFNNKKVKLKEENMELISNKAEAEPVSEVVDTEVVSEAQTETEILTETESKAENQTDLMVVASKLPVTRSQEDVDKRDEMFDGVDQNGSGQLSLAEIDLGVKNYLGEEIFLMKPAIKEAFKASKGVDPDEGDDFVEKSEFRLLMVNLRRYIELWCAFDEVDSGDDSRIDINEFKKAVPMLKEWGVTVDDPDAIFDAIDGNDGGQILFNEFSSWALKAGLDYDDSVNEGNAEAKAVAVEVTGNEKEKKAEPEEESDDFADLAERARDRYNLDDLASKIPVGRNEEDVNKRNEMFDGVDQNGSGQLSLAEIELGILNYIGEEIFLMKPAIKEAYKAARGVSGDDGEDEYFVDRKEFRLLMVNIRRYIELYAAFDTIDSGDDDRVDFEEFKKAIPLLEEWEVTVEDPEAAFDAIDGNDGGQILFNEFARWAIAQKLDFEDDLDEGDAEANAVSISQGDDKEDSPEPDETSTQRTVDKDEEFDLNKYLDKLPVARDHESTQERKELFDNMDQSANGQLSLAEIELGVLSYVGSELMQMKPAIRMAYKASRGVDPKDDEYEACFVDFKEFRILLVNIRRYLELYAAFDNIDDGDDGRINYEEFSTGLGMLEEWGVKVEDPENEFDKIDGNDGGQVLFNEFSAWALNKGLDYDSDADEGDAKAVAQEISIDKDEEEEVVKPAEKKMSYEKVDFSQIAKKLPVGRDDDSTEERAKMFRGMDQSCNNNLSLAEIDLGILNYLGEDFHEMKPAVKMAYKAARDVDSDDPDDNDSFVEFSEFRILLVNLRRYFELYAAFDAMDTEDDNRINLNEFTTAMPILKEWGISVENPEETFGEIDTNGGGQILFGEFAEWALRAGLDYESDFEEGDAKAVAMQVDVEEEEKPVTYENEEDETPEIKEMDFKKIAEELPVTNETADKKRRKEMFKEMDASGSGELSLAEIQGGLLTLLGADVAAMSPAISMAYKMTKDSNGKDGDYVERSEMKTLMICLRRYLEIYVAFDTIDSDDDRRIDYEEFEKALPLIKEWGIDVSYPQEEFDCIDSNDGDKVLFDEFCGWAIKQNLDVEEEFDDDEN